MNPIDDQLNRLFRAAAKVTPQPAPAPAFGLETRAMAAWREAQKSGSGFWDMALLTRGLIVAGVIMAVSLLPALQSTETTTNPFADYLQLTDSTVASDDAP
jgi:hypothetical protein